MLHQVLCFSSLLLDERRNYGHIVVCCVVYVFVSRVCLFWKFVPLYIVASKK